ncbi:hypothetical protein [Kosakonia radicincitans]|uniref:hypothetical protein n=1 Tax=Kosakonia radicincitans TaxID=283686 RepID=UPI0011821B4C|nr:hypothetical protein [Kosakonia radicincitans]
MNKTDFNEVLDELGPVVADYLSKEMKLSFPEIIVPSIHFEICTLDHLEKVMSWPDTSAFKDGYGGWSWEKIYHKSKYSPEKFIVAVSSNGVFGGLFSGKLLASEVELQYVQRDVRCHSLKGNMISASIIYSAFLGSAMSRDFVSVCEPAPAVVWSYARAMKSSVTYEYDNGGAILRMRVPSGEIVTPPPDN